MSVPRDGFAIIEQDSGTEVHFVACEKNDSYRDKVESGLLRNVDLDRFIVVDTRWPA